LLAHGQLNARVPPDHPPHILSTTTKDRHRYVYFEDKTLKGLHMVGRAASIWSIDFP
jgi:hypothetical protein